MTKRFASKAAIILLCCCALVAEAGAGVTPASDPPQDQAPANIPFPDPLVVNQDGKQIHFYSDLAKGKVVAINFVYTTCVAFCSMQGRRFVELQNLLGDRLGTSVALISITADPETDTPQQLKQWATSLGARPGWTLVTGEREGLDRLVKALTGDVATKGVHTPVVYIGYPDKGVWVRAYALADPHRLTKTIDGLIARGQ